MLLQNLVGEGFIEALKDELPHPLQWGIKAVWEYCPLWIQRREIFLQWYYLVSMDMNLSKLWGIVEDREAWYDVVHGVAKRWNNLTTEQHLSVILTLGVNI